MAIPLVMMGIGSALQIAGQWQANMEQAKNELLNAKFFEEQAQYARLAEMRSEQINEFDYTYKIGQQVGDYAASNVDVGSGSAAITVGGTVTNMLNELWAVKTKGELDVKMARLRSMDSQRTGEQLQSFGYNALQAGGSLLKLYTASEGFGKGFPSWMAPSSLPPSESGSRSYPKYFPNTQSALDNNSRVGRTS